MNLAGLSDFERWSLDEFLALPGAAEIVQTALAASHTGMAKSFLPGKQSMFSVVAYGDDAMVYRHAVDGVQQAVSLARALAEASS